ncbi:unnamed protein product, partial [Ectocarpus sp. 8 AP-2014]
VLRRRWTGRARQGGRRRQDRQRYNRCRARTCGAANCLFVWRSLPLVFYCRWCCIHRQVEVSFCLLKMSPLLLLGLRVPRDPALDSARIFRERGRRLNGES